MIYRNKAVLFILFVFLFYLFFSYSVAYTKTTKYGGVAVFSFYDRMNSFDPANCEDFNSLQVCSGIFEGLVKFDPESNSIIPALARKWMTSDYKTWTFFLQKDIKFHDGTDFTSESVKFNFDRQLNNRINSNFSVYKNLFGKYGDYIVKIETPERYKVRIILAQPDVLFLYKLAMPASAIPSQVALKKFGSEFPYHPVGTGPFYFSEWRRSGRIILNKNVRYNDSVYLDRIIFEPYTDIDYCVRQMLRGITDISTGISIKDFEKKSLDSNFDSVNSPSESLFFLLLNPEKKEFKNASSRRAVSYLIDKKDLANEYDGTEAYSFLTSSMLGYVKKNFSYNKDDINSFIASIDSDRVFTLIYPEDNFFSFQYQEGLAIKIQKYLRAGGVKVALKKMPYNEYISALSNKNYDMAFWVERDIYGTPDIYLPLIYSVRVFRKMTGNSSNWVYDLDSLMLEARAEINQNKRKIIYSSADNLLFDNMPSVPLFYKKNAVVFSDRLDNVKYIPSGVIILKSLWVKN